MIEGLITCDVCKSAKFTGNKDSAELRRQGRESGWRFVRISGNHCITLKYIDVCPSCEIPPLYKQKLKRQVIGRPGTL